MVSELTTLFYVAGVGRGDRVGKNDSHPNGDGRLLAGKLLVPQVG